MSIVHIADSDLILMRLRLMPRSGKEKPEGVAWAFCEGTQGAAYLSWVLGVGSGAISTQTGGRVVSPYEPEADETARFIEMIRSRSISIR